jgi:hypothetical protein
LIFESDNVRVNANTIGTNQIGIFAGGNHTQVYFNHVSNSLVLDGVAVAGNHNTVELNEITQSDQASVEIQGNNTSIFSNEFLAADFGILIDPGSTATNHFGNQYFATLTEVSNGATADASSKTHLSDALKLVNTLAAAGTNAKQRVSPSR